MDDEKPITEQAMDTITTAVEATKRSRCHRRQEGQESRQEGREESSAEEGFQEESQEGDQEGIQEICEENFEEGCKEVVEESGQEGCKEGHQEVREEGSQVEKEGQALIAALEQVSGYGRARRLLPPLPSPFGCAPARVMLALRIAKFAAMAAPVLLGEAPPLLG